MSDSVKYVFEGEPATGETREVAPGVHWLRMPLPFQLNHINLWLLEDGDGWTIIDTGINSDDIREAWEQIFASDLGGRPVRRLIVTHFHPDHMGLAGWIAERWGVEMWATLGEWAFARMVTLDTSDSQASGARRFYQAIGLDGDILESMDNRRNDYIKRVVSIPSQYRRLSEDDVVDIDGRGWRIIIGNGHSPEHACLYCAELNVLISGDQVLPRISPNISVWYQEPDADPLRLYLESLPKLLPLPADTLVLPSHNWPFTGLHGRIKYLADHHDARLDETLMICTEPRTGMEVVRRLFRRDLDAHQVMFAIGESLAHLHCLMGQGRIERAPRDDGVYLYRRAEAAQRAGAAS